MCYKHLMQFGCKRTRKDIAFVGTFSQGTQRPVVNARFKICKISVRVLTDRVRFGKERIKRGDRTRRRSLNQERDSKTNFLANVEK